MAFRSKVVDISKDEILALLSVRVLSARVSTSSACLFFMNSLGIYEANLHFNKSIICSCSVESRGNVSFFADTTTTISASAASS